MEHGAMHITFRVHTSFFVIYDDDLYHYLLHQMIVYQLVNHPVFVIS
jgi:hypothetical protein